MRIYIQSRTRDGAWGGGNQFLKALRQQLRTEGVYTDDPHSADAVLFNGYQDLKSLVLHFFLNHRVKRIYRLGPVMSLHRPGLKWKLVDYALAFVASLYADVVIFQSSWSLAQAKRFGFWKRKHVFVIPNAVDSATFYPVSERTLHQPIRLIYTSWSDNQKKGFSYVQYLDTHLDMGRYSMEVIGNIPVSLSRIVKDSPQESTVIADRLRAADIFVSPTEDDACSNAIIEALACGIPVVARASGGNEELVGLGGALFSTEQEMMEAIDRVALSYDTYQRHVTTPSITDIAARYINAIRGSIKTI